jgi:hypothetical protein
MTMRRFNVCVKRTYTNKQGEEKTSWPKIGVAFESDRGISGTIEMVPTGAWDGRFALFLADEERAPSAPTPTRRPTASAIHGLDDDIGF